MCFKQRLWFVGANTKLLAIMVCQFYSVETRDVSHPAVWCPANTKAVPQPIAHLRYRSDVFMWDTSVDDTQAKIQPYHVTIDFNSQTVEQAPQN